MAVENLMAVEHLVTLPKFEQLDLLVQQVQTQLARARQSDFAIEIAQRCRPMSVKEAVYQSKCAWQLAEVLVAQAEEAMKLTTPQEILYSPSPFVVSVQSRSRSRSPSPFVVTVQSSSRSRSPSDSHPVECDHPQPRLVLISKSKRRSGPPK